MDNLPLVVKFMYVKTSKKGTSKISKYL